MKELNQEQTSKLLPTTELLRNMQLVLESTTTINQDAANYSLGDAILDAATVIPIKTAAVSMLALTLLFDKEPEHVALYGTGKQALAHIKALLDLYPNIIIDVIASNPGKSLKFVQDYRDRRVRCTRIVFPEVDLVITATNSKRSVYSLQADTNRMVIGVGSHDLDHAELGRNTINNSTVYTDDIELAKQNAGDLNKAEVNWETVQNLQADRSKTNLAPILFKNMGAKKWDQAIINCALDIKQEV